VLELPGMSLSSLTLSPDELELVFSAEPMSATTTEAFFHARRASKADAFSAPVALPELDLACTGANQTRSGDLSFDGLAFYFTCYDSVNPADTPLRVARRANLDAPFVLDPTPLGSVRGGPSLSRNELEIFSAVGSGLAMRYTRSDTSAPFGAGEPIAGFESFLIRTPEIAADGLTIFASQSETGSSTALVSAIRSAPGAAFGPLTPLVPEPMNETFGSSAISNDCRSLYYVHILFPPSVETATNRAEVMSR
jgi:hypothetical protein